jgi:hypothetical protein
MSDLLSGFWRKGEKKKARGDSLERGEGEFCAGG